MCQYSCHDGLPTAWHLVHLGSRAVGGAGLVMTEATSVSPEGRISPGDTGLWSDAQAEAFRPIAAFISEHGAVPALQLAHAGRKASTAPPWDGGRPLAAGEAGWQTIAPSALPFTNGHPAPREMSRADIEAVTAQFSAAARRARLAGFEVVEIHMAHGYLMHQFLSPLSNRRADEYGGPIENRMRLPLAVVRAVREAWPSSLPVFARISATDWVEGGWDLGQSVALGQRLKEAGVDLIDCSSGGSSATALVPAGPSFQVPFAAELRARVQIPPGAVGFITSPAQAETIVATGQADAVLLGREFLRDPYWPMHAAQALGVTIDWPRQYERAKPS
jgi:2,4-dienoyl-CoA reductase-like NADH-dependent reductase (Old Yellow Enzyme family)